MSQNTRYLRVEGGEPTMRTSMKAVSSSNDQDRVYPGQQTHIS